MTTRNLVRPFVEWRYLAARRHMLRAPSGELGPRGARKALRRYNRWLTAHRYVTGWHR